MKQKKQPEPSEKGKPLKEIDLQIDEFGRIVRDVSLENINAFLDENVPDKKLEDTDSENKD